MQKLELYNKTGYEISKPEIPVIILDKRGKIFYDNTELKSRKRFNLPEGEYYLKQGYFTQLNRPVEYQLNKLPLPERLRAWPFGFNFVFAPNSHKATINWRHKVIIFDPSLREKSLPELYFILFHEFAHSKFKSEKMTDALAENMMLKKGFNPSQISGAPITSLSSKQFERKKEVVSRMFKRNDNE
jgi:hypothetical protein